MEPVFSMDSAKNELPHEVSIGGIKRLYYIATLARERSMVSYTHYKF